MSGIVADIVVKDIDSGTADVLVKVGVTVFVGVGVGVGVLVGVGVGVGAKVTEQDGYRMYPPEVLEVLDTTPFIVFMFRGRVLVR